MQKLCIKYTNLQAAFFQGCVSGPAGPRGPPGPPGPTGAIITKEMLMDEFKELVKGKNTYLSNQYPGKLSKSKDSTSNTNVDI